MVLSVEASEKFKPERLLNQVGFSELLNHLGEVASALDAYPDGFSPWPIGRFQSQIRLRVNSKSPNSSPIRLLANRPNSIPGRFMCSGSEKAERFAGRFLVS